MDSFKPCTYLKRLMGLGGGPEREDGRSKKV
jgi:hypothetical protein